jgi:protease-4
MSMSMSIKVKGKIAILPIKGVIYGEEPIPFLPPIIRFPGMLSKIRKYIESVSQSQEKEDIKGMIFEIDSPGGAPYPSKELARMVKKIDLPTVAWIEENCLSGAYWIASSCDKIVCDELSRVGGIGVAGIRMDLSEFMKKFGVQFDASTTGRFKDLGLPFKSVGREEKEIIDEELSATNKIFVEDIIKNRNFPENEEKIKEIKEGRYYLGTKAKDAGLVDLIGGREEAIELCKKAAGIDEAEIVDYGEVMEKESLNWIENIVKRFFR